jgi:hypothetical protein
VRLLAVRETARSDPAVWWVNQGATFRQELAGGFLWAPLLNEGGRPEQHWETLAEVRAGDIIVHYARGAIVALGRARSGGRPAPRPEGFRDAGTRTAGRLVEVECHSLPHPIPRGRVADRLGGLAIPGGPIARNGAVKQGYLWRFGPAGLRILREAAPDPWPPWAEAVVTAPIAGA